MNIPKMQILAQTDWLGSRPVFYNEKTRKISGNVNDVIDSDNIEFHPEGLRNYLAFGYSVFGQTPVRYVRFLPPSAQLIQTPSGLAVESLPDPADSMGEPVFPEEEALELIRGCVTEWEQSFAGDIILPTSGGYDSRLLNLLIAEKARIRAYSYGISDRQEESGEIVRARLLSERLGTRWEPIALGEFHSYLDSWYAEYGVSTHAHGMYHLEFYTRIADRHPGGGAVLSGIVGDAWAGAVELPVVTGPGALTVLGHSHGVKAAPEMCLLQSDAALAEEYYSQLREKLADPRRRIIEMVRLKMILLSYLFKVPEQFGFSAWSPFARPDVALAFLSISPHRRHNRQWQSDHFRATGVDVDKRGVRLDETNSLDLQALDRVPLVPLSSTLLREIIRPQYVDWINRELRSSQLLGDIRLRLRGYRLGSRVLRAFGKLQRTLDAYHAYVTLWPLQKLIEQRGSARSALRRP